MRVHYIQEIKEQIYIHLIKTGTRKGDNNIYIYIKIYDMVRLRSKGKMVQVPASNASKEAANHPVLIISEISMFDVRSKIVKPS